MNRTIIVSTRVSERQLNTTYINLEGEFPAYIMTVVLHELPLNPIGLKPDQVPQVVGKTFTVEHNHESS